ncbi:MAG TPA: PKD domain-containing protein [Candidatus Angelobacter sp.]|nr:PKD domain-containing protein [Candidatus Angelobacter sp.]
MEPTNHVSTGSAVTVCFIPRQYMTSIFLLLTLFFAVETALSQTLTITPTTTVAKETANNTSASSAFVTQTNGNAGAGNVSKSPHNTLLYSGNTTRVYTHFMGWFGSGGHMNVGYLSTDASQVHRQVADMKSRGIAGAILDWYGQGHITDTVLGLLRNEAEEQGVEFSITEDVGAVAQYAATHICDGTQKMIDDLNYVYTKYENSPAYMKLNGRPVVFFFGVDAYFIDWSRVLAGVAGNPIFIFRNAGAFTSPAAGGGFSWIEINLTDPYDINTGYLDNFYSTAIQHPDKVVYATGYPGFNDTLAGWSGTRIMNRQCGTTWLKSFAETGKYYNTTRQLPNLQIATWNDYDEGSEIESGIDNCLQLVAWTAWTSTSGGKLYWQLQGEGSSSTISYFRVFISTDGTNLMRLKDVSGSTRSLSLTSWSLSSATKYTLYVKAVGKPSILNKMSNPATFRKYDLSPVARLTLTKSSGAVPLTVTASTSSSTDSDGRVLSSKIDFGDGTVVAGPTATHTYSNFDVYVLRAYVYDDKGAMSTTSKTVTAKPATPGVVIAEPLSGSTVSNKFRVVAYASATLPVTSMRLYVDGKSAYTVRDDRFDLIIKLMDGQHRLAVNAWDSSGAVQQKAITVQTGIGYNPPPNPVLQLDNFAPTVGMKVRACTALSTDNGSISSSAVDYGDGSAVQYGTTTYHAYANPGTYIVKASITDDRGKSSSTTATVTVTK